MGSEKVAIFLSDIANIHKPKSYFSDNMHKSESSIFRRPERMFGFANYYAARLSSARVYANLALYYLRGVGVQKDLNAAFENFKKASELGDKSVNVYLSAMLRKGIGASADFEAAKKCERELQDASNSEISRATYAFLGYENDDFLPNIFPEEISKWAKFGAERGIEYCMRILSSTERLEREKMQALK